MLALSSVEGYHGYVLFAWMYGLCLGGFLYSMKMLTMERVRGRHFTKVWGEWNCLSVSIMIKDNLVSTIGIFTLTIPNVLVFFVRVFEHNLMSQLCNTIYSSFARTTSVIHRRIPRHSLLLAILYFLLP